SWPTSSEIPRVPGSPGTARPNAGPAGGGSTATPWPTRGPPRRTMTSNVRHGQGRAVQVGDGRRGAYGLPGHLQRVGECGGAAEPHPAHRPAIPPDEGHVAHVIHRVRPPGP